IEDHLQKATSIFNLEPTRKKVNSLLDETKVAASGVRLRMVAVSLDSGAIRYVKEDGQLVERDGSPVSGPNERICTTERAAATAAQAAMTANPGNTALASAAVTAQATLNVCLAADPMGHQVFVRLVDGAIASSSIPCIFPPTKLGDEAYVD